MWVNSSELKPEYSKGLGSSGPRVRNQVTLDDEDFLVEESYVNTMYAVWVAPYYGGGGGD